MQHDIYVYLLIMSIVTLSIRILPLTLIRRQITNSFLHSFLYYVPFVTLAVMTFPAIVTATQTPLSGGLALIIGILLAWRGVSLFGVAGACCAVVFAVELIVM